MRMTKHADNVKSAATNAAASRTGHDVSIDRSKTASMAPSHIGRKASISVAQRFVGMGAGSGNHDHHKKEAVTDTQKSVLCSKIVFFMFLVIVASVAGGVFAMWYC